MNYTKEESHHTKRKVCFVPADTIVPIETRVDFSEDEKKQCWYSKEEMQKMQNRCLKVAERLDSSVDFDNKKKRRSLCSRGLEGYTTKGMESQDAAIAACIHAVMDEQDIQWSNGYDDYDRFAVVSQEVSKDSIDQAIKLAMRDEQVAIKIHWEDQQRLSPPTVPKRTMSREDLSLYIEPISDAVEPQKEVSTLEDPKVFTRAQEQSKNKEEPVFGTIEPQKEISFSSERKDLALLLVEQDPILFAHTGRDKKDSSLDVDLIGTSCCPTRKDIRGSGRIVPLAYCPTMRAKAA